MDYQIYIRLSACLRHNSDDQYKQKRLPKEPLLIIFYTVMITFVNLHPKVTLAISLSSTIYFYFNLVLKRSPEYLSS
jgi:hypothetical protein